MANTFAQACREAREDMAADGLYDMGDASIFYDFAEALLMDPEFKKLAKKEFPNIKDEQLLRECVADRLY